MFGNGLVTSLCSTRPDKCQRSWEESLFSWLVASSKIHADQGQRSSNKQGCEGPALYCFLLSLTPLNQLKGRQTISVPLESSDNDSSLKTSRTDSDDGMGSGSSTFVQASLLRSALQSKMADMVGTSSERGAVQFRCVDRQDMIACFDNLIRGYFRRQTKLAPNSLKNRRAKYFVG